MLRQISSVAAGRRSRWLVIGAWLVLAVALAPLHSKLQERAADESDTFMVRGSDSAEADRLLEERFTVGNEVVTTIVYELGEPDGTFLSGEEERITNHAVAICESGAIPDLRAVFTPGGTACDLREPGLDIGPGTPPSPISEDMTVALTTVLTGEHDTTTVVENVARIRDLVRGPDVHVSGAGGFEADRAQAVEGIDGTLLAITATLILVILLAVYRSPLTAAVPLAVVAVAYVVAAGLTWGLVSIGATTISGQTTAILIVLMFGAGTDYCLLIVARFRDELRTATDADEPDHVQQAMARAAERTGPAILSAGAIVAGVMLLLALADFNATREMGPILALGMAVTVLAGITLLPAVLGVLGRAVFWPAAPAGEPRGPGVWARAARLVERRPAAVAAAVTAVLAAGALGNLGGRESLDFTEAFRDAPDSVEGVREIRESFPPGRTAPLELVMTESLSGEILTPLAELPEIDSANWSAASKPSDEAVPLVTGELVLNLDPFSPEAAAFVPRLRAEVDRLLARAVELRGGGGGDELAVVGGLAAETYDTEQAVAADTRLIVPLALALIFVVLAVLLRAIVAPLYLTATVVLSFLFALGVGSLVFTHLFDQPGSDPSLTIFAFIFLVGLGVDYNIFLVGRIQEERRGGLDTRQAVLRGLARTGGVITSAGLILAGTFSALMALTFEALFQFGFVLALGLLVDTFLVRALLVPSLAYLLGERNWWPQSRASR
jgi:putative drug exporter of the RND superfamily